MSESSEDDLDVLLGNAYGMISKIAGSRLQFVEKEKNYHLFLEVTNSQNPADNANLANALETARQKIFTNLDQIENILRRYRAQIQGVRD